MRGAAVAAAAGVFVLMAVILALVGGAWLLYFYLPVATYAYFWGFFAMAAILLVVAVGAGLLAARIVKRSSPPVPTMAIDEAKKIRDTRQRDRRGQRQPPAPRPRVAVGAAAPGAHGAGAGAGAGSRARGTGRRAGQLMPARTRGGDPQLDGGQPRRAGGLGGAACGERSRA